MAIFFVVYFFSLLWNRILHLQFGMSSVSFMSFLLKAFALLWRELDNVGFMGFLRVRMFTLNLVVVLFWQISCLENYVTKIYESFFLDCLQQCPASLLTGGDKIKMYGGVIGHYWTTCLTWALRDVCSFCWFPSKSKPLMRWGWERWLSRHLLQPLGRGQFGQSSPPGFSSTHEVVGLDSFEWFIRWLVSTLLSWSHLHG